MKKARSEAPGKEPRESNLQSNLPIILYFQKINGK
jgi:hypothetical protein